MAPPAVACSPPATTAARSAALPIGARRARLPRLSDGAGGAAAAGRANSEDGASPYVRGATPRFSFSSANNNAGGASGSAAGGCASRSSLSVASSAAGGAARPPAGPSSAFKAAHVLVGFDAAPLGARPGSASSSSGFGPAGAAASAVAAAAAVGGSPVFCGGPLSPGRRETKPSLLSLALSDLPDSGATLTFAPPLDLFGGVSTPQPGFLSRQDSFPPAPGEPDMSPLNALVPSRPALDAPVVRAAYIAAARAHEGQYRKSGEPVLSHCLETAVILADLGLPEETIAAGLLHDVLSDTRVTAPQLEEHVPRSCVELVEKVTRISDLSQLYRDNAHTLEAGAILEMLTSMADVSALLIKLADRLHNMRTLSALPRCKQVRVATETLEVFAVLANRLGAWAVKAELEDLAFAALQPEDHAAVSAAVAERTAAADLPGRVAAVRAALEAAGVPVVDVSGRVKNAYGVWKKLRAAGLGPERLGEVYDVAALRVVVPHKHDCYRALREVEGLWAAVPGRFKDYVRNPKANGYQSLHTSVLAPGPSAPSPSAAAAPLEVQIRTPKMHYIAEYGFAAHWRYKEKLPREDLWLDRLVQWKKWVAAEKLRLRDYAKVRPGGSPQRDLALAGLVNAASAASAPAAVGGGFGGASSALAARRLASVAAAEAEAAAGSPHSPRRQAELDARFMERFRIRPVDESDLGARAATILVSGPRGVRAEAVPAGATLAELAASGALPLGAGAGSGRGGGAATAAALRVNGRPVAGRLADVRLRAGDHVSIVPAGSASGTATGAPLAAEPAAAAVASGAAAAAGAGPQGQMPRVESLEVFLPGRGAPVEVALRSRLASSTARLRQAALAS